MGRNVCQPMLGITIYIGVPSASPKDTNNIYKNVLKCEGLEAVTIA